MSTFTVIGTGNIGSAVAGIAAAAGQDLQVLGRNEEETAALVEKVGGTAGAVGDPITGDIVVLAVPYPALSELAETYGDALSGKVVVDVSNPVNFETFDELVVPADSSAAAELQELLPDAKIVKAFNTNFAATLASGTIGDATTTVMVAGDDEDAKQALIDVVTAGGLQGVNAGSLKRAREMEAFGFLQMVLAGSGNIGWDGGFAVVK